MALEVGQKLYYVDSQSRRSNPAWVTITKVGRKWATSDWRGLRFEVDTLIADGGNYSSPGRAYLSEEEYVAHMRLVQKWASFQQRVSKMWTVPEHLSEADIDALLSALSGDKQ